MTLVTVIGRGHSGTRAISHTLYASGVYMGATINRSGDLVPPEAMYEACRVLARHVEWQGGLSWDFSQLHSLPIPEEFTQLIHTYLHSVLEEEAKHPNDLVGWKIPETTLVFPWIVRMFPDAKYIFWVRDPRDCVLNRHITDDLAVFGVAYPPTNNIRLRRAISWKYQVELVKATAQPANWLEVRFEDFVLRQEETLSRLEAFLGIPLARIIVRPDAVGRYRLDNEPHDFDFFAPELVRFGYA